MADDRPPAPAPSVGDRLGDLMRNVESSMTTGAPARSDAADIVGTGSSTDGLAWVDYSADTPVSGLRLDPRIMQYGTEAIAEAVQTAVRQAYSDFQARCAAIDEQARPGADTGTDLSPASMEPSSTAVTETANKLTDAATDWVRKVQQHVEQVTNKPTAADDEQDRES